MPFEAPVTTATFPLNDFATEKLLVQNFVPIDIQFRGLDGGGQEGYCIGRYEIRSPPVPPGRPRCFDLEKALDSALQVFWRKGYEGASLTDLTEAMGINRPSLYAAFGNKESLFRKVLDRYGQGPARVMSESLGQPTARGAVERMLTGAVAMQTDPANPRGCLAVQGALACGPDADVIRQELTHRREMIQTALQQRLARAITEGDLPADTNPEHLARFIMTIIQGLAVQSAGGASPADLQRVVEIAMRAWPGGEESN
jgi:AcrR family transcriptional regulator